MSTPNGPHATPPGTSDPGPDARPAPWTRLPALGFDTETTGVDPATDRIVTAALVHRSADVTEVRTWLVDPGVDIPAPATAVHGITTEQARAHGADPAVALEEIATQLHEALAEDVPVVAFNAPYDLSLLDAELVRHGLRTLGERLGRPVGPVVDPLVLDRALDPERTGPRTLGATCAAYGVLDPDGPRAASLHAADVDVVATLDLLAALAERFPRLAAMTLAEVTALQDEQRHEWAERRAAAAAERRRAAEAAQAEAAQAEAAAAQPGQRDW